MIIRPDGKPGIEGTAMTVQFVIELLNRGISRVSVARACRLSLEQLAAVEIYYAENKAEIDQAIHEDSRNPDYTVALMSQVSGLMADSEDNPYITQMANARVVSFPPRKKEESFAFFAGDSPSAIEEFVRPVVPRMVMNGVRRSGKTHLLCQSVINFCDANPGSNVLIMSESPRWIVRKLSHYPGVKADTPFRLFYKQATIYVITFDQITTLGLSVDFLGIEALRTYQYLLNRIMPCLRPDGVFRATLDDDQIVRLLQSPDMQYFEVNKPYGG